MIGHWSGRPVLISAGLAIAYTIVNASADAAAKVIAADFAAAQLLAVAGVLVALFSVLTALQRRGLEELRTTVPGIMAVRSALTVASATFFFWAFKSLILAEIFVFVGLMPLMAALLTPLCLKETPSARAWVALLVGSFGVVCLFPHGLSTIQTGHIWAFLGSFTGVASIVASRMASQREDKPLALVFYPNLAMGLVMAALLPSVYQPMSVPQLGIVVGYAVLLFVGRYLLVKAVAMAPAYVVTPLMNAQFLWMVILGATVFGEVPGLNVYLGALLVIAACIKLVLDEAKPREVPFTKPAFARVEVTRRATVPRPRNSSRSRKSLWHSGSRSRTARRSALR
jgi:drug/metabolite transporter (DMT)-like permease